MSKHRRHRNWFCRINGCAPVLVETRLPTRKRGEVPSGFTYRFYRCKRCGFTSVMECG